MANVKPIPDGSHSVTAGLIVKDTRRAIDFYKKAFGATELGVMPAPDGKIMHAEIKIGDTKIYINDEIMGATSPQSLGGSTVTLNIYTEDCDTMFERAINAGATVKNPMADAFWGDRYGTLVDPYGHVWGIMTHKEDVSNPEMERRMKEQFAGRH